MQSIELMFCILTMFGLFVLVSRFNGLCTTVTLLWRGGFPFQKVTTVTVWGLSYYADLQPVFYDATSITDVKVQGAGEAMGQNWVNSREPHSLSCIKGSIYTWGNVIHNIISSQKSLNLPTNFQIFIRGLPTIQLYYLLDICAMYRYCDGTPCRKFQLFPHHCCCECGM